MWNIFLSAFWYNVDEYLVVIPQNTTILILLGAVKRMNNVSNSIACS